MSISLLKNSLLKNLCFVIVLAGCASAARNSKQNVNSYPVNDSETEQPVIASDRLPKSLMDLPQTQDGGFVLAPGFYEAEFKTYCLQPGTPDPRPGDAYLQGPVMGYRKEIIESVLLNSRNKPELNQKNIQLLLWSIVSGSDFNKLSPAVQADAKELLTSKQIFELRGGVVGIIKTVSYSSGILNVNNDMKRLFEIGTSSYESYERLAVLKEPSQIRRKGVKYDQWYKKEGNYYVRYFPASYQKVRIQVFVPDSLMDSEGKVAGEYIVFDPTGQQAIPAFTNSQRLGVGSPVLDIVRIIIQVNKGPRTINKAPEKKSKEVPPTKQPGPKGI
jgi:hypothetical protein